MKNIKEFPPQTITPLEAGKRQLKEAIWLFFEERDPIAIHTLTKAAHEILFRLGEPQNVASMVWNHIAMKPKFKKEYVKAMNTAANFFKHAGENPQEVINFKPRLTHFFLSDAIRLLAQIKEEPFFEAQMFNAWFVKEYPETLEDEALISLFSQKISPMLPSTSDLGEWLKFLKNQT